MAEHFQTAVNLTKARLGIGVASIFCKNLCFRGGRVTKPWLFYRTVVSLLKEVRKEL
jgi:hypothetical protein